ncbi:hypothetical protein [Actinomadura parmotrematis]|uniref:HEAT repeat domain-containing protein n=1 Tax=Actinomadura parmotrematis TaxID=2864039 RepID=A0ABS7G247_9ACTN|nr:hypothetical protein [Actinomadura parmotrematis]MBW8486784.1 hypothetical protein [Actinomadura parmotrematis]
MTVERAAEGDGDALDDLCLRALLPDDRADAAAPGVLAEALDAAGTGAPGRADLLRLAVDIAAARDGDPAVLGAVRAALAARAPLVLGLLADPDEGFRATAVELAGLFPPGGLPVAALRERYAAEDVPMIRASLLAAAARLDPGGAVPWLLSALAGDGARTRLAAAWCLAVHGLPWPDGAPAAVAAALRGGDPFRGRWWRWSGHPLGEIVGALPAGDAAALVRHLLADAPETAAAALHAACARSRAERAVRRVFGPLFRDGLGHPDVRVRLAACEGARVAGLAGEAAAALAGYAAAPPPAALEDPGSAEAALLDAAILAMMVAGDQRWRGPLAAVLETARRVPADDEDGRLNALDLLIARDERPDPALARAVASWLPLALPARVLAHWGVAGPG